MTTARSDRAPTSRRPGAPRAAVGRADLVRLVAGLPPEQVGPAAAWLGFDEPRPSAETAVGSMEAVLDGRASLTATLTASTVETAPMLFWRLEEMTFPEPPARQARRPGASLTRDDLAGERSVFATPRLQPLAAWSRLWPAARDALGAVWPGRDPDVRALIAAWGRGEVVRRVPQVPRRAWAERASVWIDRSARLVPFWSDQMDVFRRVRAACGHSGARARVLDADAQARSLAVCGDLLAGFRPDPGMPVFVLGDLGAYGTPADRAAWLHTGRRLRCAGVRVAALVPAPPARWDAAVARVWEAAPWERGRTGKRAPAPREPDHWQARAERLLRVASAAAFVQPGLLRALRLLLPAFETDASAEADVWAHADVRAADATGLALHADAMLRLRESFATQEPHVLQARVRETIRRWHDGLPRELLRAETLAWLGLDHGRLPEPGARIEAPGEADARGFAERLEASLRLRVNDARPETAALRRFARTMLAPMPDAAYQAVSALQLTWAAAFKDVAGARVPAGLDAPALFAELESPAEERWWAVRQLGGELVLSPSSSGAWPSHDRGPGSPLAWMLAAQPHLYARRAGAADETALPLHDDLRLPLRSGEAIALRTDRSRIVLACWQREPWAVAAGRDRFGLWAEADVNGVPLKFRWIPPGRFRMGSPASEAGRYNDEGPQHFVTWTKGRWLADAPVTQALWQAVMDHNPSQFQSVDRPVEQVSWDECMEFVRRLVALVPGLDARPPSEAEWEHACRAGTETATWLGDLEILGDNNAPLLDSIAWYGGNCGVRFELANGHDITGSLWEDKQYPDTTRAGTHPIRGKDPNPLGLFDMLGNVYEWCMDAWDYGEPYAPGDVVDPPANGTGTERVVRGGSWRGNARDVRAAVRSASVPADRSSSVGLRVARGQEPGTTAVDVGHAARRRSRPGPEPGKEIWVGQLGEESEGESEDDDER